MLISNGFDPFDAQFYSRISGLFQTESQPHVASDPLKDINYIQLPEIAAPDAAPINPAEQPADDSNFYKSSILRDDVQKGYQSHVPVDVVKEILNTPPPEIKFSEPSTSPIRTSPKRPADAASDIDSSRKLKVNKVKKGDKTDKKASERKLKNSNLFTYSTQKINTCNKLSQSDVRRVTSKKYMPRTISHRKSLILHPRFPRIAEVQPQKNPSQIDSSAIPQPESEYSEYPDLKLTPPAGLTPIVISQQIDCIPIELNPLEDPLKKTKEIPKWFNLLYKNESDMKIVYNETNKLSEHLKSLPPNCASLPKRINWLSNKLLGVLRPSYLDLDLIDFLLFNVQSEIPQLQVEEIKKIAHKTFSQLQPTFAYEYTKDDTLFLLSQIKQILAVAERLPPEQIKNKIILHGLVDALYGNTLLALGELNSSLQNAVTLVPLLNTNRIQEILKKRQPSLYAPMDDSTKRCFAQHHKK